MNVLTRMEREGLKTVLKGCRDQSIHLTLSSLSGGLTTPRRIPSPTTLHDEPSYFFKMSQYHQIPPPIGESNLSLFFILTSPLFF